MATSTDVDRGWSWVVMCAAFMVHVISHGFIYTFGLYFIAIEDTYGGSKAAIAWIPSIITGGLHLIGPFASMAVNRFGCQLVGTVGAGMAFLGIFFSLFASNIYVLYITMGTVTGAGIGLMFLPSVFCVTVYFNKYRGMACGLALSGCGAGIFVLSPLCEYLLQNYGLKGTLLINSGLMLNCIPCCLMYRTLIVKEEDTSKPCHDCDKKSLKYINSDKCDIHHTCELERSIEKNFDNDDTSKEQLASLLHANKHEYSDVDIYHDLKEATHELLKSETEMCAQNGKKLEPKIDNEIIVEIKNRTTTKFEFSENDSTLTRYTLLLKSPKVLLFFISQFLFISTTYIPFIFIPDKAKQNGIEETGSAWIVSAIGMGSIFGRIILGFVADRPGVNKKTLFKTVFILCGVSTACCPWLNTLWSLLVYAVIYGIVNGTTISLTSVVLLDTVGISSLADAIGLNYMISGLGGLVGPPFVGMLYDLTDSYTATFLFAGGAMASAGMLIIGL